MKKYAATIRVLVTLRVKESLTTESGRPEWTVNASERLADPAQAVAFVRDAVASWGGQAPPDYVFFPTNLKVTTRRVR